MRRLTPKTIVGTLSPDSNIYDISCKNFHLIIVESFTEALPFARRGVATALERPTERVHVPAHTSSRHGE